MRVHIESELECPVDDAWQALRRSDVLCQVNWPLVAFASADGKPLPETWSAGQTLQIKLRLFGFLPLGVRTFLFEVVDPQLHQIQTREKDLLIKAWDHRMSLEPIGDDRTRYIDDIEIHAGIITPIPWLFAQWLYRHRRRKWKALALRLAADAPPQ